MTEWSVQEEIALFQSMRHNKPVGVNKHFAIVKVVEQLKTSLGRHISVAEVLQYLETLYDVAALDEFETVPFPNEITDFFLPEQDFPETISDLGSESVADSLELETSTELPPVKHAKSKSHHSDKSDDHTPRRPPKRTRASSQNVETTATSSVKRRRV